MVNLERISNGGATKIDFATGDRLINNFLDKNTINMRLHLFGRTKGNKQFRIIFFFTKFSP